MNILAALDDPNLLGASIRDPASWKPWRALLTAAGFHGTKETELAVVRALLRLILSPNVRMPLSRLQ